MANEILRKERSGFRLRAPAFAHAHKPPQPTISRRPNTLTLRTFLTRVLISIFNSPPEFRNPQLSSAFQYLGRVSVLVAVAGMPAFRRRLAADSACARVRYRPYKADPEPDNDA